MLKIEIDKPVNVPYSVGRYPRLHHDVLKVNSKMCNFGLN